MEAAAAAAAAMDFNTLSRRELQALCKRNGVRANMTNAAMAEALQGLTSVDGIDEIGTTLCLPTPGRSAMKSAAKMVAVEEQQHGSPLPRGRRVSVKSPEAIRMDLEEGENEMKEIVKTPGVALRSTRRGTRATPAPLPTPLPSRSTRATTRRTAAPKTGEVVPTPATRRSQRTASRKAAGAVEADRPAEDLSRENSMTIALDQEAEVVAAASKEEKVQQDEPKAAVSDVQFDDPNEEEKVQQEEPKAASDVECDDREEEEVAKFLEGHNKEEELEEGQEADSVTSCTDPKVEEVVVALEEQPTKPHEGIVKEQEPISVEKYAPLTVMEDSPILGVIEKEHNASAEEDLAELSPAREMTDEINPVTEDNDVAINEEAIKEDEFDLADAVVGEDETIKEDEVILTEGGEGAADEMPQAGETSEEDEEGGADEMPQADEVLQAELADNGTSEDEDDLTDVREGAAAKMLQGELTEDETSEEDLDEDEEWASDDDENTEETGSTDESDEGTDGTNEGSYAVDAVQISQGTEIAEGAADEVLQAELADNETSEVEDDLTDVREGAAAKMLQGELSEDETSEEDLDEDEEWASDDNENTEEIGATNESDGGTEETNEGSNTVDAVQMLPGCGISEEADKDASTEDDDFSDDLPPEFDNIMIFSDAETESDISPPVLEENKAVSATKNGKSLDDSALNAEQEEGPKEADATEKAMKEVDNIVKSMNEITFKEEKSKDYDRMSLRKLKITYKKCLIAAKEGKQEEVTEGKRLPLEEVDENTCIDH